MNLQQKWENVLETLREDFSTMAGIERHQARGGKMQALRADLACQRLVIINQHNGVCVIPGFLHDGLCKAQPRCRRQPLVARR